MKKRQLKKIATLFLSIGCLFACGVGVKHLDVIAKTSNSQGTVQIADFDDSKLETFLQEIHYQGEEVQIPEIFEAGVSVSKIVSMPDGNAVLKDSIVLSQAGEWKLSYQCKNAVKEYTFVVYPSVASISGAKSQVNVGKASEYLNRDAQGRSGIVTQVAYNEMVTFNEVIDLNGKTKADTFFEFSVLPEVYGLEDASILVITLTDAEDPENKIELHLRGESFAYDPWMQRVVYARTGAPGQTGIGLYEISNGDLTYDEKNYLVYGGGYDAFGGTHLIFSLRSVGVGTSEDHVGHQVFGLSMDYAEKRLYAYTYNSGEAAGPHIISDYDDPNIYGDNLWGGFKSGKCRVSISAKNYLSSTFSMLVTKLGEKTVFENQYIENDTPAEIVVTNEEMDKIPYLVKDRAFTVPQAVAYDVFGGEVAVTTNVYTGYETGAQANVQIIDGKFTPTQYRPYTIVYTCKDIWGNISEKIYKFDVVSEQDYQKFVVTVASTAQEISLGETVKVKKPKIPDSYIGHYKVEVTAKLGAETVIIGEYDNNTKVEAFKFVPQKAGNWLIVYKYSDMYVSDVAYYSLTVHEGGESYFLDEAAVPHYAVINAKIDIPTLSGYNCFGAEILFEEAIVYVTADGNIANATPCTDSYVVWTEQTENVYITYQLGDAYKQYVIPVVDVGYGTEEHAAEEYFYGYQGTPEITDESFNYMVGCNALGEYKLGFVNKVLVYNWKFDLAIPQAANYSGVSVYLYDTEAAGNVLKLQYIVEDNGRVAYSLNDGAKKYMSDLKKGDTFSFKYDSEKNRVSFMTATMDVYTNLSQTTWAGFTSNMAWMEIVLENVTGNNTQIQIEGLNNQRFYAMEEFSLLDMAPEFYQNLKAVAPVYNLNSIITIPPVYAWDVFALDLTVKLTAVAPDGSILMTLDGMRLEDVNVSAGSFYQVALSVYGEYSFNYTIKDELGRVNKRGSFQVKTVDSIAPTIEIGEYAEFVKLNSVLKLAKITIRDDIDLAEQCKYSIYIHAPNYQVICMDSYSGDFVLNMKGAYTIWYYVVDSSNNVAMVNYKIYVK